MQSPNCESVVSAAVLKDCQSLTASKLRDKYKLTYDSWRNMKQRRKTHDAIVAPQFEEFSGFLACVGPRPSKGYTLDRLDNSNPEYGPGLVQWRSVAKQNSNKGDTVFLTDADGTTKPLMVWAQELKISPHTLYSRRKSGWSDAEIIHGKKIPPPESLDALLARTPWPEDDRLGWERAFQDQFAKATHPIHDRRVFLVKRQRGNLGNLRQRIYELAEQLPPYDDRSFNGLDLDAIRDDHAGLVSSYNAQLEHLRRVEHEIDQERRRKRFSERRIGLGRSAEGLLFDYLQKSSNQ